MVFKRSVDAPTKQRKGINKLTVGFASVAAAALIGTTGIAAAAQNSKPSKADCARMGYTNYGQCVSNWAQNKSHPGGGYGGNSVNVNANIDVSGSNNVVNIIIRAIFH
jgi:hypothetical protein